MLCLYIILVIFITGPTVGYSSDTVSEKGATDKLKKETGGKRILENFEGYTYTEKAEFMYDKVFELYYIEGFDLFLENYPCQPDDRGFSYLWPFSGVFSAVNAMSRLPEKGENYRSDIDRVLRGLERYWDKYSKAGGYDCYVVEFGGGQKFYDDNTWIGLEVIRAYEVKKDIRLLNKAKQVFNFVISGWSEKGGIYWREHDFKTRNTCSNGPAIVFALKLYQITGEQDYLDWGLKIYKWVNSNLYSPGGAYWDSISSEGKIDKRTYTYNTGIMLHANVLLYQITKDEKYLNEAEKITQASLEHFAVREKDGIRFFPDTPWFNNILFKGYLALYEINKDSTYIEIMIKNVDYAWMHARDKYDLIGPDWSGETKGGTDYKWLLDQAAMVELYALISIWKNQNQ